MQGSYQQGGQQAGQMGMQGDSKLMGPVGSS